MSSRGGSVGRSGSSVKTPSRVKRGSGPVNAGGEPLPREESNAQKWLRMAGAMHDSLERLRNFYSGFKRLADNEWGEATQARNARYRDILEAHDIIVMTGAEAEILLDEIKLAASSLLRGLKARESRGK